MKNRRVIAGIGIVVFCVLVVWGCGVSNLTMFIDFVSFIFIAVGGSVLAFMKMPKTANDFLKYFSKTSLLSGVLGAIIGCINSFGQLDFAGDLTDVGVCLSVALITIFYGLIFSGISYALYRDEAN